jgi:hypothetical protein
MKYYRIFLKQKLPVKGIKDVPSINLPDITPITLETLMFVTLSKVDAVSIV